MLITGVHIPADESQLPRRVEFQKSDLEAMQSYVGGLIEPIDFDDVDATMWCHEEALMRREELNRRASLLLWVYNRSFRFTTPVLGDVLITGRIEKEIGSIPLPLIELLFFHNSYATEFKLIGQEEWASNRARYDSWIPACNAALRKHQEWLLVEDIRVLPASGFTHSWSERPENGEHSS